MAELKQIPSEQEMQLLLGFHKYSAWRGICSAIGSLYEVDCQWNECGRNWKYECKYRRGGKTLCTLYAKQDGLGCMVIFGKGEREKVDAIRSSLSSGTLGAFDSAKTYHDGKWVMFDDTLPIEDMKLLLRTKRRPNRQAT